MDNYPSDEDTARFTKTYLVAGIRDMSDFIDGKTEEEALDLFHNSTLQKVFDFSRNFLYMNGDIIGDQIEQAAQDLWDTQIGNDRRGPDMRLSAITGVPFREAPKLGFIHHPEIWKEHTEVLARIGRTLGHIEIYLDGEGYLVFSNYWTDN